MDPVDRCPQLAALIGGEKLRRLVLGGIQSPHQLHGIFMWEARRQELESLERACDVMETVFRRSPKRVRAQVAGNLRKRKTFEAARAELMAGARLELLNLAPVMEGEVGPQPDFLCTATSPPFYGEVYTPGSVPEDDIIGDVNWQLRTLDTGCMVIMEAAGIRKRTPEVARDISVRLRQAVADLRDSGKTEAVLLLPHGGDIAKDWHLRIGQSEFSSPPDQPPRVWARLSIDGVPHFRLGSCINPRITDDLEVARNDLRGLRQLRKGAVNVLALDLTARRPAPPLVEAYRRVAVEACGRHPELAGVLISSRGIGLHPAPSRSFGVRSSYELVPSERPGAAELPIGLDGALTRPRLIHSGQPT